MNLLALILALLTGAAGWFYLFYSRAAETLADVEDERLNRRRALLRRIGGGVMLLLGAGFYVGYAAAADDADPRLFVAVWSAEIALMGTLVVLALIDLRLTVRLRKHLHARTLAARNRGTSLDRLPPP